MPIHIDELTTEIEIQDPDDSTPGGEGTEQAHALQNSLRQYEIEAGYRARLTRLRPSSRRCAP